VTQLAASRTGAAPGSLAGRVRRCWATRSLGLRIAVLLTLALLPLGLLAFEQTKRLEAELQRVQALNFHALATEIARREASAVARAAGAAVGLAATLPALARDAPEACQELAAGVVARSDGELAFVGYLPRDGTMRCSSTGEVRDFSGDPEFDARMADPRPHVTASPSGRMSRAPVISLHEPVRGADGSFAGYVTVSLGAREIALPPDVTPADISVAVVDEDGEVLGATLPREALARALPAVLDPAALAGRSSFTARDRDGATRDYTVEPIVAGTAYAIGIRSPQAAGGLLALPPAIYPLAMWVASVALVLGMIEASLIGPVRALGARIRRFGQTRALPERRSAAPLPRELAGIEESFNDVARQLSRDEKRLIDALHAQEVLLKEVHHRVKNNLQIISSMINLQVRGAESAETQHELARINARIASLATVHRRLYDSQNLARVRFDGLLRDVIARLMHTVRPDGDAGVALPEPALDLAPLELSPDQALPGAMFAVEALTNAFKHSVPDAAGRRWIRVTLAREAGEACLTVASSGRGAAAGQAAAGPNPAGRGRQLGHRLIEGFARQLRGTSHSGWEGESYVARVCFAPKGMSDATAPEAGGGDGAA
jgi:two-component sensor histidine kinase